MVAHAVVDFPRFGGHTPNGHNSAQEESDARRKQRVFMIHQKAQAVRLAKELGNIAKRPAIST